MKAQKDLEIAKKYMQLYTSAKARDIEFDLTIADVRKLVNAKTCAYTKVKFGTGCNAKSVDRIDNDKGYVTGNVVACTIRMNQAKGNLTMAELKGLLKFFNKQ